MSGRKVLFISVLIFSVLFGVLYSIIGKELLEFWNVPTNHPSFIDLRGVLTGFDAVRLGFDPIYENPLDPYQRPVAYPRIWFLLGFSGASERHTVIIAIFLLAAYALSLFVGLKDYDKTTALWLALAVFSPASMLCYQFGNVELVIFILLSFMLLFQDHFIGSMVLLELAAFLKLFPIVGLGCFISDDRKKSLRYIIIGILVFAVYLVSTWTDTSWALSHAPKEALRSYGIGVISIRIYELTDMRELSNAIAIPFFILVYVLIILALYFSNRFNKNICDDTNNFIMPFRLGSLLYLATFFQGSSYNYRLIFLFFLIPQLVYWAKYNTKLQNYAKWTLALVIISDWGMILTKLLSENIGFALDEIANWILFVHLLFLFLVSAPEWIRSEIRNFFNRYKFSRYSEKLV